MDEATLGGLAAVRAKDPAFDIDHFLQNARGAYATIVRAFTGGDRDTLRPLVSAEVMGGFEAAMNEREAQGRSESVEFLQPVRADVEESKAENDVCPNQGSVPGRIPQPIQGSRGRGGGRPPHRRALDLRAPAFQPRAELDFGPRRSRRGLAPWRRRVAAWPRP